jgi:peptide chain release factor 2
MEDALHARLQQLQEPLQLTEKRQKITLLQKRTQEPDFWSDQESAVAISTELAELERVVKAWDDLHEMIQLSGDMSESERAQLENDIHALELQALLSDPHDSAAVLLTIHAGTGGTDAQDWAAMLSRMYLRFVEQGSTEQEVDRVLNIDRSHWVAEILEESRGEEAGIKRVVMEVRGRMAYGLLKSEVGVHRLVRQSPFNAKGLRQTSFALVEVVPEVDQKDAPLISDVDLRIDIFRSGGAGGQHVNTTDSAVRITHIPTGIVVVIQNERSQHQNKATAMKVLQAKLARLQELKNAEEIAMLKGEVKEGSWGNQIRSYVLHPYQLVKDHRTNAETSQTEAVLDGNLKLFIETYLKANHQ